MKIKWFENGVLHESFCSLRKDVFVEEQGFPIKEEFDDFDNICPHVAIFCNENICATGRYIEISADTVKIGRIAVKKSERKKGYGAVCVKELLNHAKNAGYKKAFVGAQTHAVKFYEKCGFTLCEGEPYLECNIPHVDMEIVL